MTDSLRAMGSYFLGAHYYQSWKLFEGSPFEIGEKFTIDNPHDFAERMLGLLEDTSAHAGVYMSGVTNSLAGHAGRSRGAYTAGTGRQCPCRCPPVRITSKRSHTVDSCPPIAVEPTALPPALPAVAAVAAPLRQGEEARSQASATS